MTALAEATKKFREKNSKAQKAKEKILVQNVEWDLDPSFIGEPMVPRVLKQLSVYVDKKLTDYSAIYGANPATNMPRVQLRYDNDCVTMGHNPERPVDAVEGDNLDEEDYPVGNTTNITREVSNIRVHPGVRTREELETRVRNDEGVIIDDPDLFNENWMVKQHLRDISENVTAVEDELRAFETEDKIMHRGESAPGSNCQVWLGDYKKPAEEHTSSEIKILPESSLFHGPSEDHCASLYVNTEGQLRDEIVEKETEPSELPLLASLLSPGELKKAAATFLQAVSEEVETSSSDAIENLTMLLPGTSEGAVFSDSGKIIYPDPSTSEIENTSDEIEANFANTGEVLFQPSPIPGVSLEGINPANFRLNDDIFSNGAEGFDPTRQGVDNHVASNGALPGVRFRIRDSFIRNRHLTLKVPQAELMGPNAGGKDITYVTSYTIEHQTQKIKARIITAPPNLTLDDELWFELCTNNSQNDTLKDVIKSTVKANLCIHIPNRSAFYDDSGTNLRAEKTALETLRDMITEQEFRHYLRYGFLTVKGFSGRIYQIFRNNPHTKIWERGKLVEEVCVRIKHDQNVPLTDNVIAFKVMIETNEDMFRALGNVYKMDNNQKVA